MNQIEIKKRQIEMYSHVLGIITLFVLGNILGDNGIAYIAFAVESFLFFWTFTGSRLADTLGKLLRGRSARGQYRNAAGLRRNALLLGGCAGLAGSVVLFACAGVIGERILGLVYSVAMIRLLAPVVFLRTLSAVLLGYFQGEGTELPAVISCVMRQICILVFSLIFANLTGRYGGKVSALLREENFTAMHGGLGVALAVLASEALVLLFLTLVYRGSRRQDKRGVAVGMRAMDTFAGQVRVLYTSLFPSMLIAALQQLPVWMGIFFFRKSVTELADLSAYGIFYGKYLALMGLLTLPGCAVLLGSCYKTAGCVRREEPRYTRGHFAGGLHLGVVYGSFFTVFTTVLAPQLAGTLCRTGVSTATGMLRYGSFILLFTLAGFYFSEILLLLGGKLWVSGALALQNLVFLVSLMAFLNGGKMGIMALVNAGTFSSAVYAAITGVMLFYQIHVEVDWLQGLAVPAGAACAAGFVVFLVGRAITPHVGNVTTVILCLVIGAVCYAASLLLLRNFGEQELNYIPGGKYIRRIGRGLRLY